MKTYLVPFLRFYNDLALRLGNKISRQVRVRISWG
jgi:hypothetical protein